MVLYLWQQVHEAHVPQIDEVMAEVAAEMQNGDLPSAAACSVECRHGNETVLLL